MKIPMLRSLAAALAAVMLIGCASVSNQVKMDRFNTVSRAYGSAIVWSQFEAASLYRDPQSQDPDLEHLRNYRVAAYDVKNVDLSEDKMRIVQVVEIKYYRLDTMIVKTLRDEQLWTCDPETKQWHLKSGLPGFE